MRMDGMSRLLCKKVRQKFLPDFHIGKWKGVGKVYDWHKINKQTVISSFMKWISQRQIIEFVHPPPIVSCGKVVNNNNNITYNNNNTVIKILLLRTITKKTLQLTGFLSSSGNEGGWVARDVKNV